VACGYNEYGQLGNNTAADVVSFTKWQDLINNERVVYVASGYQHTVAVTGKSNSDVTQPPVNGTMYGFGLNDKAQLTGLNPKVLTPQAIPALPGKKWVYASCGCSHTVALTCNCF
jgi:alpha-tubulin suppressor-like RCC1 family protein